MLRGGEWRWWKGSVIGISPTEPMFTALGPISSIPERYGCDFIFGADSGLYGVQRKEYNDFVASVMDGRLGKELGQMVSLQQGMLCIEGRPQWTEDGMWLGRTRWSRASHFGYLWGVRARGVWVEYTDSPAETAALVTMWERWVNKPEHGSLVVRGGPPAPAWGKASNVEFQEWMLQSMPGVGAKVAHAIVETLGCPLAWKVGVEELMSVPGIGKVRAEKLIGVFDNG